MFIVAGSDHKLTLDALGLDQDSRATVQGIKRSRQAINGVCDVEEIAGRRGQIASEFR